MRVLASGHGGLTFLEEGNALFSLALRGSGFPAPAGLRGRFQRWRRPFHWVRVGASPVESRRGAVAWAIRHHPVSPPRSSNAACGFPALRSPTGFFAGIRRAADMSVIHVPTSPWRRDTACLEGPWSYRCFTGLRQYTDPRLLPQAHQKSGSFPPPALPGLSSTTTLSDSRRHRCPEAPLRPLPSCQSGSPPITRTTFPACCAQYPGGPDGCVCRFLPRLRGLPRYHGGSASTSVLSRPARASLALRPAGVAGAEDPRIDDVMPGRWSRDAGARVARARGDSRMWRGGTRNRRRPWAEPAAGGGERGVRSATGR